LESAFELDQPVPLDPVDGQVKPRRATVLTVRLRLIARLSKFKFVFTLSSSGYCAVHWLVGHNFSIHVFSSALVFGAIVAASVPWLSHWFSSSSLR